MEWIEKNEKKIIRSRKMTRNILFCWTTKREYDVLFNCFSYLISQRKILNRVRHKRKAICHVFFLSTYLCFFLFRCTFIVFLCHNSLIVFFSCLLIHLSEHTKCLTVCILFSPFKLCQMNCSDDTKRRLMNRSEQCRKHENTQWPTESKTSTENYIWNVALNQR